MNLSLESINEIAISLLQQNSLNDLVWDFAHKIGTILGYEHCLIYLSEDGLTLRQVAAWGVKVKAEQQILNPVQIPFGQRIAGLVAQSGKPEIVLDTSQDPRYVADEFTGRSEIAVPIIFENKVIGVVDCESSLANGFSQIDIDNLLSLTQMAASRIGSGLSVQNETQWQPEKQQVHGLLQNEKDWLAAILESLQEAIISVDSQAKVRIYSRAATLLTGISSEQAVGRPIEDAFPVSGFARGYFDGRPQKDIRGQLMTADGKSVNIAWSITPMIIAQKTVGHVIAFRDVTHQDYLERQAERAQRIESLGVFVGGIAHDFNNNLQSTLSTLQAARSIASTDLIPFLDIAAQTCEKSGGLTKQLMSFAKGSTVEPETTQLDSLVADTAHLIMSSQKSSVEITAEPELHSVNVDRSQIEQVISNLLINSKQSYPDGGKILVRLSNEQMPSQPNQKAVRLQIKDEGCGIPKDQLDQVFEPYYSTKPEGNGLGLPTSKFIVQRHGGEIQVHSEPDQGTTIDVFLPAHTRSPETKNLTPSEDSIKILFIDDEPVVRQGISALIQSLGYQAVAAASVNEALQIFDEAIGEGCPFDLVIIDLNIPDSEGGVSALNKLRTRDPKIPAIITSGYSNDRVLAAPEQFGFSGVLAKPFNRKTLLNEIQRSLQTAH